MSLKLDTAEGLCLCLCHNDNQLHVIQQALSKVNITSANTDKHLKPKERDWICFSDTLTCYFRVSAQNGWHSYTGQPQSLHQSQEISVNHIKPC